MKFIQTQTKMNDAFRNQWVINNLMKLSNAEAIQLLDVGAGSSPYKSEIQKLGITYKSHDFNKYSPINNKEKSPGLQNYDWDYAKHDYVCEILDLNPKDNFEIILCTEVFEHIPDPIRALEKLSKITKPGGSIIITVPFLSLMHQSPYWFQAGLSPYWFEHWAAKFQLSIEEMTVSGTYTDLINQELNRYLVNIFKFKGVGKLMGLLTKPIYSLGKYINADLQGSGAFGTLVVLRKPN
jgi:2-polyprenyl-3-methyl-5-hydroxy-6-metoxy-1,4-benzoquinol methylase